MRRSILVVALVMLGVIQAVPYSGNHTNPPVRVELPWDSERTRRLAGRLCFDCRPRKPASGSDRGGAGVQSQRLRGVPRRDTGRAPSVA